MNELSEKDWLEVDLRLALRATQVEPGLSIKCIARVIREVFPYDYVTLLTKELLAYDNENKEAVRPSESITESVEGECSPASGGDEPSGNQ